ncbi:hypothetical protein AMAG_12920 [Allomyces macrogynus ATCC 38327]|uniref:Calcineurin-like phosphoesterase domain-containing protein n=1 Tax=Allomyces macrogynus (strain ATCC 38327) TaxID=578462 RepID=A0A0L0T0F0_ALLM3|nr:hypothetical protein AMAG_12920 [Allomyces macrogynus ATCC 38327]|eukprot:KNE68246.1 hypothetical protein AMAG_12920 [Allomyces macrogynus ATCC 38327]
MNRPSPARASLRTLAALAALLALLVAHADAFGTQCGQGNPILRKSAPAGLLHLHEDWADGARHARLPRLEPNREANGTVLPRPKTRIAFLGDQGLRPDSLALLKQVKDWKPHAVVHLGDFDYRDNPVAFDAQIDSVFGPHFPYLAAIGNHDLVRWTSHPVLGAGYRDLLAARLRRIPRVADVHCDAPTRDMGEHLVCTIRGVQVHLSGVGTYGAKHAHHLANSLSASNHAWRVCGWHKNQRAYQSGSKPDETGYKVYDSCRAHGAVVATAHEHAYSRTALMGSFEKFEMMNATATHDQLDVRPGSSFAFVTGLGGESVRSLSQKMPDRPWLVRAAGADQNARAAAVLCEFYPGDDPFEAKCEVRDAVRDEETVYDQWTMTTVAPQPKVAIAALESSKTCIQTVDLAMTRPAHLANTDGYAPLAADGAEFSFSARADLPARGRVVAAHLQVMGATGANADTASPLRVDLRLQKPTVPAGLTIQAVRHWYQAVMRDRSRDVVDSDGARVLASREWTADEWEKHEVWVSPNLVPESGVDVAEFAGTMRVRVAASGKGKRGARWVFTGQGDACLAPSLMLHVDTCA